LHGALNEQQYNLHGGDIMAEEKVQDYTDDKDEGHEDTREKNFECEDKDPNLGCDPGIDVAG
jgi:hypothetical protein